MTYVAPNYKSDAFTCPFCGTYAHMVWQDLQVIKGENFYSAHVTQSICSRCRKETIWRNIIRVQNGQHIIETDRGELLYPDNDSAPLPAADMPEDVKNEYIEASRIFSRSPRGAAALLRLGLQKLCRHLGESGENINNDIRALADKGSLPPAVIRVADTVRITGNNAVHPGEMAEDDIDYIASKMFGLLNFIVNKAITEPKDLEDIYKMVPEGPRTAAETRDAKARKSTD